MPLPPGAPSAKAGAAGPREARRPGSGRRDLLVAAAVLLPATVVFWLTRLDLAAADLFRTPCCSWPLAERSPWIFFYRFGAFPGVLLAAAALAVLTASYWWPRALFRWRRPALFLVLAAAIGPGLLVNVLFKDHYGRPRPREVQALGGEVPFLPVWVPGPDPQAKSFPCGHCAIGFYLATPYLFLRRRRRGLALAFLALGLAAGGVLGLARMMAGGHFLSDVLWAGGMVWLSALALHRALGVERALRAAPPAELSRNSRQARLATALTGAGLGVLTLAALVATPYFSSKRFVWSSAELRASPSARWEVELDQAALTVEAGSGLELSYQVQAFGLPTSRLDLALRRGPEATAISLHPAGFFTERRTQVQLRLPADGVRPVRVRLARGPLILDLRGFGPAARVEVMVDEGEVRVRGAEALERGGISLQVRRGRVTQE